MGRQASETISRIRCRFTEDGLYSTAFIRQFPIFYHQGNPIARRYLKSPARRKLFNLFLFQKKTNRKTSPWAIPRETLSVGVLYRLPPSLRQRCKLSDKPILRSTSKPDRYMPSQSLGGNTRSLLDLTLNNTLISRGQGIPQVPEARFSCIWRIRLLLAGPVLPERATV